MSMCNPLDPFGLCFPRREGCCSLYYVVSSYPLLLHNYYIALYLGVKRAGNQRALKDEHLSSHY